MLPERAEQAVDVSADTASVGGDAGGVDEHSGRATGGHEATPRTRLWVRPLQGYAGNACRATATATPSPLPRVFPGPASRARRSRYVTVTPTIVGADERDDSRRPSPRPSAATRPAPADLVRRRHRRPHRAVRRHPGQLGRQDRQSAGRRCSAWARATPWRCCCRRTGRPPRSCSAAGRPGSPSTCGPTRSRWRRCSPPPTGSPRRPRWPAGDRYATGLLPLAMPLRELPPGFVDYVDRGTHPRRPLLGAPPVAPRSDRALAGPVELSHLAVLTDGRRAGRRAGHRRRRPGADRRAAPTRTRWTGCSPRWRPARSIVLCGNLDPAKVDGPGRRREGHAYRWLTLRSPAPAPRRRSATPGWPGRPRPAADSTGVPVRIRFTGTSSFLPDRVRGTART